MGLHAGAETVIYLLADPSYAGQAEWPLVSFPTDDLVEVPPISGGRSVVLESFDDGPFKDRRARHRHGGGHGHRLDGDPTGR